MTLELFQSLSLMRQATIVILILHLLTTCFIIQRNTDYLATLKIMAVGFSSGILINWITHPDENLLEMRVICLCIVMLFFCKNVIAVNSMYRNRKLKKEANWI